MRARIVDAAGPVVSVRWSRSDGAYLFLGGELRPLFPALFFLDRSRGYEMRDILLQSLSVELGAAVVPLAGDTGVGIGVGFGVEVPLLPPSRSPLGPWLRIATRYVSANPDYQSGPGADFSEWTLYATLSLRAQLDLGLSGWEPARYR